MEISGIGGSFMSFANQESVSLTDDQKTKVQEIISQYDLENLSKDDFEAIIEELKAEGIPRSKDTIEIMKEAGFEPPQGPPPKPMNEASSQIDDKTKTELLDLLQQYKSGGIDEEGFLANLQSIISDLFDLSGNVVDNTV
jgi:hypothetical protein